MKRLYRCFPIAPSSVVGSLFIVLPQPDLQIRLQPLQTLVKVLAKCHPVELVQNRFVEPLADPVGLRTFGLGPGVVDILHCQIQLILMALQRTALLGP